MSPIEVIRPLLESLLAAILLYFLAKLMFRNAIKAGLLATFILLLYFTYGHIYGLIENKAILGILIGRHRILMVVWILIFLAGIFAILHFGAKASGVTLFLNRAGLVLLVLSVFQLVYLQIHANNLAAQRTRALPSTTTNLKSSSSSPDVYLIVLDAYMRSDVIQRDFKYDNTAFINQLTDLGFVVAPCAQSNYAYTVLSISSLLNMNYLSQFAGPLDPKSTKVDYGLFIEYITHSQVREQFQRLGYKIVSFEVGYRWVEIYDADTYYKSYPSSKIYSQFLSSTEFDQMLSATTLFRIVIDAQSISPSIARQVNLVETFIRKSTRGLTKDLRSGDQIHYDLVLNPLKEVQQAIKLTGNKFVYLHVPAPHPPWVLDPNGNFDPTTDEKIGYPSEVAYLDKRVIPIIKAIIQNSKNPPVIILQGDHGWGETSSRPMEILNAYYLPGAANAVYPTITPVNTFRTIFNLYFGGNYSRLPDVSYFSTDKQKYNFQVEPSTCPK
jgi:hypothetical protein